MTSDFVHLHVHTPYSLLDGCCHIDKMVAIAKQMDMPAVAMTDHGTMFGAIDFYKTCKAGGIKPIIGTEAYIAYGSRTYKKIYPGFKGASFHLVLLAKNNVGYKNLLKLSSESYLTGFYYKPRIDQELLKEHSEGIIALSACLKGEIPSAMLGRHVLGPDEVLTQYLDIFGRENFYLEIQDHEIGEESIVRQKSLELAKKYEVGLVATNDVHYLNATDYKAHDILLCIQTQTNVNKADRLRYQTDKLYFRSPVEMRALFKDYPGAIENSLKIAEACSVEIALHQQLLPEFKSANGQTPEEQLRFLIVKGFTERGLVGPEAKERLTYEFKVIKRAGFASYFLIVADIIGWAKQRGILVGPGRGSVAGSLVAFVLGITELNPLEHGLIFERFLNPDRISMPDIDMDFPDDRRGEVLEYIRQRYGADNVAQIVTFGTLFPRSLIRDVCRSLGKPTSFADPIAKLIPQAPEMTFERAFDEEPALKQMLENKEVAEVFDYARALEGLKRHAGVHAAGVVVSPVPLTDIVPLCKIKGEDITCAYDMYDVEELGLLKFDILGLKTLRVMDETLKLMATAEDSYESYKSLLGRIELDMPEVLKLFAEGRTAGIFQFESPKMQDYLRKVGVKEFKDLVIMNALYRPGPIDSGMIDEYVKRRLGEAEIVCPDKRMNDILAETLGIMVFQEQTMRVVQAVAGFTLSQADTLRKAIGKKILTLMMEQREKFIEGAVKNETPPDVADEIWQQIQTFARYGFNKSHSAGYALIAYQTAWLKVFYPMQFMSAMMTSEVADSERMNLLIDDCRTAGLKLLPPDVNNSCSAFSPEGDKSIRVGLSAIKGIGEACTTEVIAKRANGPYKNIFDFIRRVDGRKVSKGSLAHLIQAGAFDSMGVSRKYLMDNIEDIANRGVALRGNYVSGQRSIMGDVLGQTEEPMGEESLVEWSPVDKLELERQALGFYVSGHPLDAYAAEYQNFATVTSVNIAGAEKGASVATMGVVRETIRKQTRRGSWMVTVKMIDYFGQMDCYTFDEEEVPGIKTVKTGDVIGVKGRIDQYKDFPKKIAIKSIISPKKINKASLEIDIISEQISSDASKYDKIKIIGRSFYWEV